MDSKHVMYECFGDIMIDSFLNFITKLEKSDPPDLDCYFMDKLRDINKILQKLFEKSNSSTLNVQHAKEISATPLIIKKRESCCSDTIKRAEKYIRRDIEGSDDSDCEMKSVPASSNGLEDLFQTDYPDECFETAKTSEEASHQDVSSSKSLTDDTYMRKITTNETVESDQNCHYITEVSQDVYQCKIRSINTMSESDVTISHNKGRVHKLAMQKKEESDCQPKPIVTDSWIGFPKIQDKSIISSSIFECSLCSTFITGEENAVRHKNGKKHKRKLEMLA